MSNQAVKKAGQALVAAFAAFIEAVVDTPSATPSQTKPASEPKTKAKEEATAEAKPAKAPKEKKAKAPGTLKEHAEAAIAEGKFKGNTKEGKLLTQYLAMKDLRSKDARTTAAEVASVLGLPAPRKPGPAAKEKAPKAEKKTAEKKAAAQKPDGTLKGQALAALDEGKFKGNTKEGKVLQAFLDFKDLRSKEARSAAVEVSKILGVSPPRKPGPVPKEKKAAAPKAKKGTTSGKGEADAAVEASTPSPSKSTGAKSSETKPRAIDAIEMVLSDGSMNATEVFDALESRGWTPESADPKTYIYFCLSNNTDKFEKDPNKPKGYYRVISKTNGKSDPTPPTEGESDPPAAGDNENPFDDVLNEPS